MFCILSQLLSGRKGDKKKDMKQEYQEVLFGEEKKLTIKRRTVKKDTGLLTEIVGVCGYGS